WDVNAAAVRALPVLEKIQKESGKASLADIIVLAGVVGVEKAASAAGLSIHVPFAPGRVDARQDQTDIEMFELLEPIADGFRNYRARLDVSTTESLLIDKAQQLTLTAPESYGIDAGQPLILPGVQVGQVIDRKLTSKGVTFTVAIEPQHRELVKGDSKFVVNSRVDVKVGLDGVEFLGASASEWINGGIRILPGDKGEMKASYPLYANLEKALENSLSDLPTTTVSLSAETLPDVQAGSVVLYRKFEVGEVITVRPRANAFDIDLHI
ncbi:MlaD family protein, partial [Vibrio parahaemolyticus]|nr:MlaD family protein [Vibrio parahaemolyticus]